MDPTECLKQIRRLTSDIRLLQASTKIHTMDIADIAEELVTLLEALDEWCSKGGFPPDQWRQPARTGAGA